MTPASHGIYMGQAHEMGTSRGGRGKPTKSVLWPYFLKSALQACFSIHIYCKLAPPNGVTFIQLRRW